MTNHHSQSIKSPASNKFRISNSRWSQLSRQGRALCRLLHNEGRPTTEIVGIIGVTSETVVKSIRNAYAIKDNIADDFQFVDDKYIAKYKIRPRSIARTQAIAGRLEDMEPSMSTRRASEVSHGPGPVKQTGASSRKGQVVMRRFPAHSPTDRSSRKLQNVTSESSLPNRNRRPIIPTRSHKEVNDFLSSLNIGLEKWYPELEKKGMGMTELSALSEWDEEKLDKLFAKLVPEMPELLRYALTGGIMEFAKKMDK